jgi:hypothetical protein
MKKAIEFEWTRVGRTFGSIRQWCCKRGSSKAMAVAALALTTGAILLIAAAVVFPSASRAQETAADKISAGEEVRTFTVDVWQNASSNVQNDVDPAEGQILFTRGDTFVVDGLLYPKDTIPPLIADPDPNARPIGGYRLRGTILINSDEFNRAVAEDPSAPPLFAFATEIFSVPDDQNQIITEGVWPNARRSAYRVVVGGTGRFRNVVGEVYEQNIGESKASGFSNSRVTFRIRKASTCHDH